MKRIILTGLTSLYLLSSISATEALELRTAVQDSAPKYFVAEDKSVQGICPDIIRAIERIDPEIEFKWQNKFTPFKRLQHQLEQGDIDVFFGLKRTAKRLEKYRFIDIPLYTLSYKLAIRAIDATNYGKTKPGMPLPPGTKIVTVNGSAAAEFIKKQTPAMLVDDSPRSPDNMIQMLLKGRGDSAFYHDLGLSQAIKNLKAENDIIILQNSYSSYAHFAAFSPEVPTQTVTRVKKALETLKASGELDQIFKRHTVVQ